MASKIVLLVALLLLPSLLKAQNSKPSFSVKISLEKSVYDFGEEIKSTITIKNISEKKDSLDNNELYDAFGNNVYLFRNLDTVKCFKIMVTTEIATFKIFKPYEEYIIETYVTGTCSNLPVGNSFQYTILDTGLYTLQTCISKKIGFDGSNYIHQKSSSNAIKFYINSPNENEKKAFLELGEIVSYTLEQFRDTVYRLNVLLKLDEFIRENINTYSADIGYLAMSSLSTGLRSYENDFIELSEFYLLNKPNGRQVSIALLAIYKSFFKETHNKDRAIEKIENYENNYPNTRLEKESIKLIQYLKGQKEN